mmetsp:Transcript_6878/g.10799  ORF Transcript_6878/g.10799 Transcript_6878/m.10799 type:complete len:1143 (+) Transcript_6878:97-3525(+)
MVLAVFVKQVRVLCWKICLQKRRKPVQTLFEFFGPLAFVLFLALLDRTAFQFAGDTNASNRALHAPVACQGIAGQYLSVKDCSFLFYSPSGDAYLQSIMHKSAGLLGLSKERVVGLSGSAASKRYFASTALCGRVWASVTVSSRDSAATTYSVRLSSVSQKDEGQSRGYVSTGFAALQAAVEDSMLNSASPPVRPRVSFQVRAFGGDEVVGSNLTSYAAAIFALVALWSLVPSLAAIVSHEKETGVTQSLRTAGMIPCANWLAHCLCHALLVIPAALLVCSALLLFGILPPSHAATALLLFFLFAISLTVLSWLPSALFQDLKSASFATSALLLICVCIHLVGHAFLFPSSSPFAPERSLLFILAPVAFESAVHVLSDARSGGFLTSSQRSLLSVALAWLCADAALYVLAAVAPMAYQSVRAFRHRVYRRRQQQRLAERLRGQGKVSQEQGEEAGGGFSLPVWDQTYLMTSRGVELLDRRWKAAMTNRGPEADCVQFALDQVAVWIESSEQGAARLEQGTDYADTVGRAGMATCMELPRGCSTGQLKELIGLFHGLGMGANVKGSPLADQGYWVCTISEGPLHPVNYSLALEIYREAYASLRSEGMSDETLAASTSPSKDVTTGSSRQRPTLSASLRRSNLSSAGSVSPKRDSVIEESPTNLSPSTKALPTSASRGRRQWHAHANPSHRRRRELSHTLSLIAADAVGKEDITHSTRRTSVYNETHAGAGASSPSKLDKKIRDSPVVVNKLRKVFGKRETTIVSPEHIAFLSRGFGRYLPKWMRFGSGERDEGAQKHEKAKVVAVQSVDLTLRKGEVFCLLGHNGAGKSTTISMLTGCLHPSSGSVHILGSDMAYDALAVSPRMGVCPQQDVLLPTLTVLEHMLLYAGLKHSHLPSPSPGVDHHHQHALEDEVKREMEGVLDGVGLLDKAATAVGQLSGGMRRRLMVALALIGDRQVLFLDEPSTGVDVYTRRLLWNLIRRVRSECATVVLTTHAMEEAEALGDRIGIMSAGLLKAMGTTLYLKGKLGIGYRLHVRKRTAGASTEGERSEAQGQGEQEQEQKSAYGGGAEQEMQLRQVVESYVPASSIASDDSLHIEFVLPLDAAPQFPLLLRQLEEIWPCLGFLSFTLSVTSLEEVFFKLSR